MLRQPPTPLAAALVVGLAATLTACGGGDASTTAQTPVASASAPASSASAPVVAGAASATLSGTVAVGAPITSGKLSIVDASGAVVATDVVVDANGRYADVALTGPAPYRVAACGYAGPNYQCVYSVALTAGTANVTPLTSAAVLLATGVSPAGLMTGTADGLTSASVESAQAQLRTSLASVLASAGVSSTIDFVSGTLVAGSRSGYDGVLDAVGVSLGQDTSAFVQITPRIGTGNLYMEPGQTTGAVTSAPGAASLDLGGIETLFADMSAALASPAACAADATGIRRSLATNVQLSLRDGTATGRDVVAEGLCQFFGTGDDGQTAIWGSHFTSPTLGRCDLSGAAPVCGISFVLQSPEGDVQPVGDGTAVTRENGAWKFLGDQLPIAIDASAKAQRNERLDAGNAVVDYSRALAFDIAATPGVACARVSQHDADGADTVIAYYKPYPGADHQVRLSLWSPGGQTGGASLDPAVGTTRSADDTWIPLPQGDAGDAVIRNFYRGGRTVQVSLYADTSCQTAYAISGRSTFDVDVNGVPPVWSALSTMPWPALDSASAAALRSFAIDASADATLDVAWSSPHGPLGMKSITLCGDRGACSGDGRLADQSLRPRAAAAMLRAHDGGNAIGADDSKTLALFGRTSDGIDMQSNFGSCPQAAAGELCH